MPRVMRFPWLPHAVVLASFLGVTGAACKGSGGSGKQEAGKPLRIGVITSLTGAQAAFGKAHKLGYEIAASEINAKGGVLGRKIEIIYYDDEGKPDQAAQGTTKLIDQDNVPIILGAYSSETTLAVIRAVIPKSVPLIMPTATADNTMETGSPWIFRTCAGARAYASAMADFLKNNGAPKTVAIIYENTNFGQSNGKAMEAAAPAAGMTVVANEAYQAKETDYKALLQRVKDKDPEVIYYASYLLDAITLMKQTAQVDLNPRFLTAAGTGFSAAEFPTENKGAGKFAEYTFSVSQWLPSAKWEGSKQFDEAYFKLSNTHPAYHGMQAYAALMVAADAIKNAGSEDHQKIADAIRAEHLNTPFGPISFDAKGQNPHPVLITQIQGGQYKVVWPPDQAEAKPILTTPKWSERP
jgi:branched-chain amino acid transport system substrate-binding protein